MQKSLYFFLNQIKINKKNSTSFAQLKHFFNWRNSLTPEATSVKDEQPWITFDVIGFLKENVNSQSAVFEYGGGGSTLFFVKSAKEVVTVEHNKEWFELLSQQLKDKKRTNWKGKYVGAQKGNIFPAHDRANPEHYSSDDEASKGYNYKEYVLVIDAFADGYFDFVLVDGRSRASCIMHSIRKIKSGGYLILDNSDRLYYLEQTKEAIQKYFEVVINHFGASPYFNSFTKTTVWRKK